MSFFEDIIKAMNKGLEQRYNSKYSHLAKAAEVHATTVKKILSGERTTWLGALSRMADATGVKICQDDLHKDKQEEKAIGVAPQVEEKDSRLIPQFDMDNICSFIDEYKSHSKSDTSPEKYIQVPANLEFLKYRQDLIAVEVTSNRGCMIPTFNSGDLLIIDINECIPHPPPGNIYLVQEPNSRHAYIKRVKSQRKRGKDFLIYYCDNPEFGPDIFNVDNDYEGKLVNGLKGKVVASFCNMSDLPTIG